MKPNNNTYGPHYQSAEWRKAEEQRLLVKQRDNPKWKKKLKFIRDGAGWYADVAGHTRAQNAMVAGADNFLDRVSMGDDTVTVAFRTLKSEECGKPICTLRRVEHDRFGAAYLAFGLTVIPLPVWICNVTETVLGEHPKRIYVYDIKHANSGSVRASA